MPTRTKPKHKATGAIQQARRRLAISKKTTKAQRRKNYESLRKDTLQMLRDMEG